MHTLSDEEIPWELLKRRGFESVRLMVSNDLILCPMHLNIFYFCLDFFLISDELFIVLKLFS